MVIKDIIYIMVVALFTFACWLQVESVPRGVNFLPLGLSTWGLLLLVGSRWNMFHVEPDCFMSRNNLASCTTPTNTVATPTVPSLATGPQIIKPHRAQHILLSQLRTCNESAKSLRAKLITSIDGCFIINLKDPILEYGSVTILNTISRLFKTYRKISNLEIDLNKSWMTMPWTPPYPIETAFQKN